MPATVYLVDDHPLICEGIVSLIGNAPEFQLVGIANNSSSAQPMIADLKPDLVLLDLGLPDRSGLELLTQIKRDRPDQLVLILSGFDEAVYAERALKAGAMGYIMKEQASTTLLEAMHCVLRGEVYLSPDYSMHLLDKEFARGGPRGGPFAALTDREMEVFRLIGTGASNATISSKLDLSPKTVESYHSKIKKKLGLKNNRELLVKAALWASGPVSPAR